MDTSKPQKEAAHLLDDLESIRQLLGDDSVQPPSSSGETQIPLLFDVVGAQPNLTPELDFDSDDSRIPTLMPTPTAPAPAAPTPAVSKADALLHLDRDLRDAAQLIMQDVIDDFAPHIETEIKRRLEQRMERLLSQYQN